MHAIRRPGRLNMALALSGLLLVVVAMLLAPRVVEAHAYLEESSPAPHEELESVPDEIELRFTESIAPAFSDIQVLDAEGERVDRGGSTVPRDDLATMRLPLPPLPDGTYTVSWRNVSAVDGHSQRGWYVFSIGEPVDLDAAVETDAALLSSPFDPPVRWVALVGALLLAGGIVFDRAIARPALDRLRDQGASRSLQARHDLWTRRLIFGGLGLWALGTLLHLPVQLAAATGEPLYQADLSAIRSLVLDTTWGVAWLARVVLLAVAALLVRRWLLSGRGTPVLALVVLGALLTHSVASHGGSLVALRPAGIVTDYLHLVAAAVWTGGLIGLVVLVRGARSLLPSDDARAFLGRLLPRFSVAAVLSVGVVLGSGLFLSWMHVNDPAAMDTAYGRTLAIKLGLFVLMLAIGAVNLFWTSGEAAQGERGGRWVQRLVSVESVLAVLVILAVAGMTSMEPARSAAEMRDGVRTMSVDVDDVTATLRMEPGDLGSNRIDVLLDDRAGPVDAGDARLRVSFLDTDLGDTTLETEPVETGHFVTDEALFSVAGTWRIEVTATRLDGFDVRAPFLFDVGTEGAMSGPSLPIDTARGAWIALLVGVAALFHATALRIRAGSSTGTSALQWSGSAFLVLAIFVVTNTAPFRMEQPVPSANPLPASSDVLARGGEIYQEHCATCHGDEGHGDGETAVAGGFAGERLSMPVHVPMHTDRELYGYITGGVPGTEMPPFEDELTEDDVWSVMHHIRDLADAGSDAGDEANGATEEAP